MLLEIDDDDAAVLFKVLPGLLRPSDASQRQQNALARVHRRIAETGRQMKLQWVRLDDDMEMGVEMGPSSLSEGTHPSQMCYLSINCCAKIQGGHTLGRLCLLL
jgi:hypothetical protein